jgi:hypothetical protein
MPDVHLLGDVGLRVVDDDPLPGAGQLVDTCPQLVDPRGQGARQQGQIDEARSRDFKCAQVVHLGLCDQLLGDAPRRLP